MPRPILLLALVATTGAVVPARAQDGPALRGRVVTADGVETDGLRAYIHWQGTHGTTPQTDSAEVDSAGRFRFVLLPELPDSIVVIVDAEDGTRRTHHPAHARMARGEADREHGFVLVPRAWTIPAGLYAGQRVPISPALARRPACAGCSSFWVRMPGTRGPSSFQGWPASRFPLRLAFERTAGEPAGSAPDSTAFWHAAGRVQATVGRALFRPARYTQTLPSFADQEPDDVVLVRIDRALATPGRTTMVGTRGNVEYAAVALRQAGAARAAEGQELVSHELMHVLGLGHTCSWRSVLADTGHCPSLRAPAPTPEDVAYTQLLYRVRTLQADGSLRWGLDAAEEGERMLAARGSGDRGRPE